MTIIIPATIDEFQGEILIFIDDIEYMQELDGITTIILKSNIEFETSLTLTEINKKIEAASFRMFKFN